MSRPAAMRALGAASTPGLHYLECYFGFISRLLLLLFHSIFSHSLSLFSLSSSLLSSSLSFSALSSLSLLSSLFSISSLHSSLIRSSPISSHSLLFTHLFIDTQTSQSEQQKKRSKPLTWPPEKPTATTPSSLALERNFCAMVEGAVIAAAATAAMTA